MERLRSFFRTSGSEYRVRITKTAWKDIADLPDQSMQNRIIKAIDSLVNNPLEKGTSGPWGPNRVVMEIKERNYNCLVLYKVGNPHVTILRVIHIVNSPI